MPSFSERKGLLPKIAVQLNDMDAGLRNGLWSGVTVTILNHVDAYSGLTINSTRYVLANRLWHNYFKKPIDDLPAHWAHFVAYLKKYFLGCTWHEVYSLVEAIIEYGQDADAPKQNQEIENFVEFVNLTLQRDNSGYRVVAGKVVDLVDPTTIQSIEAAAEQVKFSGAASHIGQAIKHLYDRGNPDYRNSIKEAISATESACRDFLGDQKAVMSQALKVMDLHPAMREAMSKLYAYTGDESGIRHALSGKEPPTKAEAQYMISVCSAFVNYLVALAPA